MKKAISRIISSKSILLFALFLFVFNFVFKIYKVVFFKTIHLYPYTPSALLKLLATLLLGVYFLTYLRKEKLAKYIYILCAIFFIDILIKAYNQEVSAVIISRIYFFLKAIFFFLFIIAVKDFKKEFFEKTIQLHFLIAKINLCFILIGFLFKINVFMSYPYTGRFGYNGMISEPGVSSYFYMLLASIAYIQYVYKKNGIINLMLMLVAILFLGTKSGLLFIAILGFIHILILLKKSVYRISFVAALILFFIILKDKIIMLAINSFSFGPKVYNEYGLITFITSYRDLHLKEAIVYIQEHWNILNYIIGGIDLKKNRVEFEFVDIFLFQGLVGLLIYILVLKKVFFHTKQDWIFTILLFNILLISSLIGNLFFSITNAFCFAVTFLYIRGINTTSEN
jgi:hypothetical protein